jgi:hypothetical protein
VSAVNAVEQAARVPARRSSALRRNLLLIFSYLAVLTLIAGAYA